MKAWVSAAMMFMAVTGCSTIHFDKSAPVTAPATTSQWHHNFVLALVEGSEPVDVKKECGQQSWSSVKTELTFANGISSIPANLFLPIWYPKTVTVTCH